MKFAKHALKSALWVLLVILCFDAGKTLAQSRQTTNPTAIDLRVRPWYKHRKDGQPGREISIIFRGGKLYGNATVRVQGNGITEETIINAPTGADTVGILLPAGVAVDKECEVRLGVFTPTMGLFKTILVPAQRQWTVYVYPHSHVDIGYTNTQEFIRKLHVHNIDVAIDIAKKTQNYPEGSRFVWNPEADWVTEQYLKEASPEKRRIFIDAVKKGWISLDGDYANINTSATTDEELLRLFHKTHEIQKVTGVPIKTMVQMDVAGVSWGTVQAAYQNGIRGMFLYPNIGTVRWPWEHRPFYWVAPDNKTRIFFLQGLPYGFGWEIKGRKIGLGKVQGQNPSLDRITTANPTANFLDPLVFDETQKLELQNVPYNIIVVPWALADNALIDADLPDAVWLWNEKYAYPKVIISGSQRIMDDYEKRYSSILPQIKGDYSEYWTDGLGTDARRIGMYRQAPENLVQAETAWSMLNAGKPAPRAAINKAWEDCILGAEHTWGYQDPKAPLAKQIEATKAAFFEDAYKDSKSLLARAVKPVQSNGSNKVAVFNTLSWSRNGLITLTAEQAKAGNRVLDDKGQEVPSQKLSTGELAFMAKDIPALGAKTYTIVAGEPTINGSCSISNNVLSNGVISVTVDAKSGDITSLINAKTGHEYVDKQSIYGLNSYRYLLGKDSVNKASAPYDVKLKVKENGPLVVSIVVESKAEGVNWLRREIRLVKDQPWVDITNSLDKISTRTKEGVHFGFPYNIPGGVTRIDIPWGIMTPEQDQMLASNKTWLTFQHWVDISNNNTGITWTSVEAPLIEIGGITANALGGAHGRDNWYKTLPQSSTLFSWALNNHWGTNFPLEQGGVMDFRYAILPHQAYDAVVANRFGMEQHRPLVAVSVDKAPITKSWVKIGNPKVFISNLKQSDDGKGMVLRVRSVSDKPEKVQLSWTNGKPRKLHTCLANEKPGQSISTDQTVLPMGTVSYYFEM